MAEVGGVEVFWWDAVEDLISLIDFSSSYGLGEVRGVGALGRLRILRLGAFVLILGARGFLGRRVIGGCSCPESGMHRCRGMGTGYVSF